MLTALIVVLVVLGTIASVVPTRFRDLAELLIALSSLTAAILTGFHEAKRHPKIGTRAPI